MAQRILLDMIKLRTILSENPSIAIPEGYFHDPEILSNGLKTIREQAVFRVSCRKCEDAPCINVCPADALEKNSEGIINRHTNLCVSCKSCVTICPFGTMMTDFFKHHREKDMFYDLNDPVELDLFIKACPPGVADITGKDESPSENIFKLNEKVLIRDYLYGNLK